MSDKKKDKGKVQVLVTADTFCERCGCDRANDPYFRCCCDKQPQYRHCIYCEGGGYDANGSGAACGICGGSGVIEL